MSSGPITSWQIDGETMETVTCFIFGGSKITADDDCSHEIKRHLLLGIKSMTKLYSILEVLDITLPNIQMFKLVLEKAEEPEIKLPTSAGSLKKQESSRKTSISALLNMPKPLTV